MIHQHVKKTYRQWLVLLAGCWLAALAGATQIPTAELLRAEAYDLEQQIERVESEQGEFSLELFEHLLALAELNIQAGDIELAEELLLRAQHVVHRQEGVYAPRQFAVLDRLYRLRMAQDKPLEADRLQRFRYYLAIRDEPGIDGITAHLKMADWYMETGQFQRARRTLSEAEALIIDQAGPDDLRIVDVLQREAQTRQMEGACCRDKPLREALRILDLRGDDAPLDLKRSLTAALGDALVLQGKTRDAQATYGQLANQADTDSMTVSEPRLISQSRRIKTDGFAQKRMYEVERAFSDDVLRQMTLDEQLAAGLQEPQIFFVFPATVTPSHFIRDAHGALASNEPTDNVVGAPFAFYSSQLNDILPLRLHKPEHLALVRIEMAFVVAANGRARNIKVLTEDVPVKLRRLMVEVVSKARFRPALDETGVVDEFPTMLTQTFRHTPTESMEGYL